MIGTRLTHYEITGHLGSGGMGEVYQAIDSKLGRSVAIKLLPEAFSYTKVMLVYRTIINCSNFDIYESSHQSLCTWRGNYSSRVGRPGRDH